MEENNVATPENAEITELADVKRKLQFSGTVVKTTLAGAVVDIGVEIPGVVHISQLQKEPVNRVEDVVQVGQPVVDPDGEVQRILPALVADLVDHALHLGGIRQEPVPSPPETSVVGLFIAVLQLGLDPPGPRGREYAHVTAGCHRGQGTYRPAGADLCAAQTKGAEKLAALGRTDERLGRERRGQAHRPGTRGTGCLQRAGDQDAARCQGE